MKITKLDLIRDIRDIILSESRYFGMSVADILSYLEGFGNNTWIFFDTETTGLPKDVHKGQITEIAAVAVNPKNWNEDAEILGEFNEKITLNPDTLATIERQSSDPESRPANSREWTVEKALQTTQYHDWDREYKDEQDVIKGFIAFVQSFSDPVLVAQNASFDMKWIFTRSETQMNRVPVIDTMRIMQLFLIPLLRTLRDEPHNDAESGEFLSAIKRGGRYSASQGVVAGAYGISTVNWHSALADVQMLMDLLEHVVHTLRSGADIDIKGEHEKVASYQMRRSRRKKVRESSMVSEKNLRRLIRKSIIKEENPFSDAWDYMFGDEDDDTGDTADSGTFSVDETGCPIVDTWEEVFPALVSTDIISSDDTILVLDGKNQRLKLLTAGSIVKNLPCSTGANGFGNESGSGETSTGLMEVRNKVGEGQPKYMVFKGLAPTGYVLGPDEGKKAWVLTRAITLTGLQRDNRNISSRAIYIHGTNRERVLGVPASGGCIRLSNNNILWAFDNIPTGTVVYILGNPKDTTPKFPCTARDIYENEEKDSNRLLETDEPLELDIVYGEPEDIDPDPTA